MKSGWKRRLKKAVPGPARSVYRFLRDRDASAARAFLKAGGGTRLLRRFYAISRGMDCPHSEREIMEVAGALLALPVSVAGVVVEAGCFRGGSTAKLSLAARRAGRRLVVFDSFQGLPADGDPPAENIFGETILFAPGDYRAGLEEVRANVARWGASEACDFRPGWFEETLPGFAETVALAFLDVDLASSTRTALKHLYPRLAPGGVLFSHDGHLAPVIAVFRDDAFWEREVGAPRPRIEGLGRRKLIRVDKPA